jgi:hypothetical protein
LSGARQSRKRLNRFDYPHRCLNFPGTRERPVPPARADLIGLKGALIIRSTKDQIRPYVPDPMEFPAHFLFPHRDVPLYDIKKLRATGEVIPSNPAKWRRAGTTSAAQLLATEANQRLRTPVRP